MSIEECFNELVLEAKEGQVLIDGEPFNIAFNTMMVDKEYGNNEDIPTLIIKDKEEFFSLLKEYMDLEEKTNRRHYRYLHDDSVIKDRMACLFVNASPVDFLKPIDFLKRRIDFLKDSSLKRYEDGIDIPLGELFLNSTLVIKKELDSIYMETPYKINMVLENEKGEKYYFPTISYGISDGTCYVYSMINKNEKKNKETDFGKAIDRLLFKLNNKVGEQESSDYKDFVAKGRQGVYVENISDVTPNFVLALSIFIKMLSKNNIDNIKVVSYLPIRYISREKAGDEERNDRIQRNATDKLIRTFRRCAYHMDGVKIKSFPWDADEYLIVGIEEEMAVNNYIMEDIVSKSI